MAISPSIPTSFVPKQALDVSRKKQGGDNLFLLIALVILGVSVVTAGAVFGYLKYLESAVTLKNAALVEARTSINEERVEEYLRLKERFESGKDMIANHTTISRFFSLLEDSTLQNVRFDDLKLEVAEDRTARIELSGVARNFNTLAAQSNAIAAEKQFKRSIFSGIDLNTNGTVGFTLTAELEPSVVVMGMPEAPVVAPEPEVVVPPPAPVATTTPVSTTTKPAL